MANVFAGTKEAGGLHAHLFTDTSTGTTSVCQLAVGANVLGVAISVNSATGRAATVQYTRSTGVLTIGGLTAADSITVTAFTD